MRTSVPLMLRAPGSAAEGNVTAAVMLDVPVRADLDTAERLAEIGARTARLRTPTRALASRFVMATACSARCRCRPSARSPEQYTGPGSSR